VQLFLEYAGWFQAKKRIDVVQDLVVSLRAGGSGFEAGLAQGGRIAARNVVIATGYKDYKFIPLDIVAELPADRYAHTCDLVDFSPLRGKRCLIVGGRQSAFEWAALINEEIAAEVHVVYRHDMPRFEPSDWSWMDRHVDEMLSTPGWYRGLSEPDRQAVDQHFWEEAKLKLEPWLWDRLGHDGILSWPRRTVSNCSLAQGGQVDVSLDNGSRLRVDFVVLATGYHVDITRLPLLEDTSILPRIQTAGGYPVLDDAFQSTLPGVYFAGLASTRDFGPMFGFVRGCTATARLIVDQVVA
jgi:thioredoxin reductase